MKQVKIAVVGKGQLTDKQKQLVEKALQKYFNTDQFEIVKEIGTLQSPQDIGTDIDFVVSFIGVPVVIDNMVKWKKFVNPNGIYGVFKVKQLGSYDEPNPELEEISDIKFVKTTPDGLKKYVYSKTESLQINPIIRIEVEDEIT